MFTGCSFRDRSRSLLPLGLQGFSFAMLCASLGPSIRNETGRLKTKKSEIISLISGFQPWPASIKPLGKHPDRMQLLGKGRFDAANGVLILFFITTIFIFIRSLNFGSPPRLVDVCKVCSSFIADVATTCTNIVSLFCAALSVS
ncbi:hypothetical protein FB45DRAFT_558655 [Roridomyces roridus]|uniref:Uncharacterized protein n=1 Tax=Roridomyces roridus TaxID=1738132 RepID=A0AAD7FLV9_9AGAR|nr:hypothetical protein FB45DRAFT_558655 [Roridomyces roridus]